MSRILQLKIDIKFNAPVGDEPIEAIYDLIKRRIESMIDCKVVDDGNAPYYEDITEQYKQLGMEV